MGETYLWPIHVDIWQKPSQYCNYPPININKFKNKIDLKDKKTTTTTMRYHLTPIRTVIIKKSTNNKCWGGCGGKGTLLHCQWDCKLIQPLWKTVWGFLEKLGIKLSYDPTIPLLGIYPEKTIIEKDTCTPTAAHVPSLQHYLQQLGHVCNLGVR